MSTPAATSTGPALVLAPGTAVRVRDGGFRLESPASAGRVFQTGDPRLVLWILAFSTPRTAAEVLAPLAPEERAGARSLLDRLLELGLLRAAAAPESAAGAERRYQQGLEGLAALAESVHELAGDLRGLGPATLEQASARAAVPASDRIAGVLAEVEALRAELATLRRPHVQGQLAALGVDPARPGARLHIGCGSHALDGWINMDVHPAPLSLNVRWGLPLGDGCARYVFLSHMLEHLFYPDAVGELLGEIHRVLEPGGWVRIIVPDVEQCLRAYVEDNREFFTSRSKTWDWWPQHQTRLEDFLAYSGAGPRPGQLFDSHKFGYDLETLTRALGRAGFPDVRRCAYQQSPHPELRVDHASTVAGARYGERYYSLFVEARRPGSSAAA